MSSARVDSILNEACLGEREIRLLSFGNVDPTGALVCSLETISLDQEDAQYDALSYAWIEATEPDSLEEIRCGDDAVQNANLRSALQHIWTALPTQRLWVDKLCICQDDLHEKNSQLALMAEIYMRATQVQVWLGSPMKPLVTEKTNAFHLMRDAESHFQHFCPSENLRKTDANGVLFKAVSLEFAVRTLLMDLANRQWFWRTWTFQELKLASCARVWFGSSTMTWTQFELGLQILRRVVYLHELKEEPNPDDVQIMTGFMEHCGAVSASTKTSLRTLLLLTSERRATDPRDKVYGLLALHGDPKVKADYSLSVVEVYTMAARYCLTEEKSSALLRVAGLHDETRGRPSMPELPSWVPDFSQLRPEVAEHVLRSESTLQSPPTLTGGGGTCIVLRGFALGKLISRQEVPKHAVSNDLRGLPGGFEWQDDPEKYVSCNLQEFPRGAEEVGRKSLRSVDWCGEWPMQLPATEAARPTRPLKDDDNQTPCSHHLTRSLASCKQRNGILKIDPRIGADVTDGDWLCLLYGCDTLCFLRPVEVGNFQLVCWVSEEKIAPRPTGGFTRSRNLRWLDQSPCFCTDFALI